MVGVAFVGFIPFGVLTYWVGIDHLLLLLGVIGQLLFLTGRQPYLVYIIIEYLRLLTTFVKNIAP
jgi:hypothetical protein